MPRIMAAVAGIVMNLSLGQATEFIYSSSVCVCLSKLTIYWLQGMFRYKMLHLWGYSEAINYVSSGVESTFDEHSPNTHLFIRSIVWTRRLFPVGMSNFLYTGMFLKIHVLNVMPCLFVCLFTGDIQRF